MKTGRIKLHRGNEFLSFHNNTGLSYYVAWNELIDNSIDAGATEIRFECDNNSITIKDNGCGIKDTIEAMEGVIGMYNSTSKDDINKIGQYGIGLKEATMRLGEAIRIESRASGCNAIAIDIPWEKVDYENIDYSISDNGHADGTSITIYGDDVSMPSLKSFEHYDKLIEDEHIIIYKCDGELYRPQVKPLIKESKLWSNLSVKGIRFNLEIGLLHDDYLSNTGFNLYPKDKPRYFVRRAKHIGKNNIGIADGLFVNIELIDGWKPDRNKRDIIDIESIINLIDQNPEYLPRWRQKIQNTTKSKRIQDIEDRLNNLGGFDSDIGQQQRKKGASKGTVKEIGTPRKIKEAESIKPHEYKSVVRRGSNKIKGYKVDVTPFINDHSKYGSILIENGRIVIRLNSNNQFIKDTLDKMSEYKYNVIFHLIHIWLTAHDIKKDELQMYNNQVVDLIMMQHDNLSK